MSLLHHQCRRLTTPYLLALLWVLIPVGEGFSQTREPTLASTSDIEAPLLDVSHGLRAFRVVEAWLDDTPEVATSVDPIPVTGLVGVRVVLRSQGVVVGEGVVYRPDPWAVLDQPGPSVDLTALLKQATEQAKQGVRDSLADARLRAILEGRALPESKKLRVADVSDNMTLELELAHRLERVLIPKQADSDRVFASFAPAYHGLVLMHDERGTWGWVWPGEVIARNIQPGTQLVLGLKQLGLSREALDQIGRPNGIGLARFETIHIVRPSLDADPVRVIRSGADLPRYTVGERDLTRMGDQLAEHLYHRITSRDQVRGTYHPTSGRYDPPIASDDQSALLCYAIMRYANHLTTARPDDNSPQMFARRAVGVVRLLGHEQLRRDNNDQVRVPALLLLALLEAPPQEQDDELRDRLGQLVLASVESAGDDELSQAETALTAAALAAWYDRTRQGRVGRAAESLIDRLWNGNDTIPNLSALPWYLLAEEHLASFRDDDGASEESESIALRQNMLAQLVDRLCQRQVIERPEFGPDDVLGGFVLSPGPPGSPPNPDWRNAQALWLLSIALRDDRITEGRDKLGWLLAAGYSARFIDQLMMDEVACYYVRDPRAAIGGVRLSPWDNRLAPAPSAISLLALTELQSTLRSFRPSTPGAAPAAEPTKHQPDAMGTEQPQP